MEDVEPIRVEAAPIRDAVPGAGLPLQRVTMQALAAKFSAGADVDLIRGYREWADEKFPIGPGWNSAADILLRQAWMESKRQERERCATMAELYDLGTVDGHGIATAIRNQGG